MRILMLHNRSLKPGGEEESTALEVAMLRRRGHDVVHHEIDNARIREIGLLRTAAGATWSRASHARLGGLLETGDFDVVHVQNFFPLLSPAVFWAADAHGVPVVHSVRTYRIACADAFFFRDGAPCEDCLGRAVPWPAVLHGCYRSSRPGSAAVALSQVVHTALGTWRRKVDAYICITDFTRRKMAEAGLPADRLHVKPNFLAPDPGPGPGGDRFLFVGRLSKEKGIRTLLAAWRMLADPPPLDIVGDGPLEGVVREAAAERGTVHWWGRLPLAEVVARMGRSKALVFPSEWYETFGRVGAEAMATGTPVLAARIGALEEMVTPGRDGFFFTPGDAADLAAGVRRMMAAPEGALRSGARRTFEERYTEARNYDLLMDVYRRARAVREERQR